jgi:hypothetical protein
MVALASATLRASPGYELVLLDRLRAAEREAVAAAGEDEVYGLLRPAPGSGLEPRVVSPDTALLFTALAEEGPLPAYARAQLGPAAERTVARLVLDGVLEVRHGARYLSGPEASSLLLGDRSLAGRGRIGELSRAALRYGQALGEIDERALAIRVYAYGRLPLSPFQRERWPDEEAVDEWLGLLPGGRAHRPLREGWVEAGKDAPGSHWRSWTPRSVSAAARRSGGAPRYKLYVSPATDSLPDALEAVAEALCGSSGLSGFKIARGADALARPDKLVAYFDRLEDLRRAADELAGRLGGCQVHGVPFSAPVTADGLLSWGADPPPTGAGFRGSWRLWIAERLAEYLLLARRSAPGEMEPWRFALERLAVAGVDTDTWAPTSGIWAGRP